MARPYCLPRRRAVCYPHHRRRISWAYRGGGDSVRISGRAFGNAGTVWISFGGYKKGTWDENEFMSCRGGVCGRFGRAGWREKKQGVFQRHGHAQSPFCLFGSCPPLWSRKTYTRHRQSGWARAEAARIYFRTHLTLDVASEAVQACHIHRVGVLFMGRLWWWHVRIGPRAVGLKRA